MSLSFEGRFLVGLCVCVVTLEVESVALTRAALANNMHAVNNQFDVSFDRLLCLLPLGSWNGIVVQGFDRKFVKSRNSTGLQKSLKAISLSLLDRPDR